MKGIRNSKLQAQKVIISEGIALSYYHSPGERDLALVFIHGMGSEKEDFYKYLTMMN